MVVTIFVLSRLPAINRRLSACIMVVNVHMNGVNTELKNKKNPKRKGKAAIRLFVFLFLIALIVVGGYISYTYVIDSHNDLQKTKEITINDNEAIFLEIPRGANTPKIAEILKENGLIKNTYFFKILSKMNGYDGMYRSGTHKVRKNLTYDELMRILTSLPESVTVTIPEGKTFEQIISILSEKKLIDGDKFKRAANNEKFEFKFLEGLPNRENRLEGYLFPDTYKFDMKAGEKEIINEMLKNFNKKFGVEYQKRAKELGMSTDQIINLASIVEREAKEPGERHKIAGVFYNRLRNKDANLRKLQSCATIQYIFLKRDGIVKERITDEDTKIKDLYNTYLYEGLPPGPICCPGEASIKAALYPEDSDYLYFVAKGDGTHEFSKTYKEHQAATKKYGTN